MIETYHITRSDARQALRRLDVKSRLPRKSRKLIVAIPDGKTSITIFNVGDNIFKMEVERRG